MPTFCTITSKKLQLESFECSLHAYYVPGTVLDMSKHTVLTVNLFSLGQPITSGSCEKQVR